MKYKILALVVILSILQAVVDVPTVQAQGGGRCRLVTGRYWSRTYKSYISYSYWRCTGTTRARTRMRYRGGY